MTTTLATAAVLKAEPVEAQCAASFARREVDVPRWRRAADGRLAVVIVVHLGVVEPQLTRALQIEKKAQGDKSKAPWYSRDQAGRQGTRKEGLRQMMSRSVVPSSDRSLRAIGLVYEGLCAGQVAYCLRATLVEWSSVPRQQPKPHRTRAAPQFDANSKRTPELSIQPSAPAASALGLKR